MKFFGFIVGLAMVACRAESRSYIAQQPSSISQQDAIFYPSSSSSNSGYKPQPNSGSINGSGGVSYNNNRQPYNSNTCRGCQDRPDAYNSGPVAFSASRADLYTRSTSSNGNIVFDQTETDVGYGWNAQRGVFVCQTPGVYVFSWSTVSPSGTEARVSLFRDGREAGAHTWSDGKGYQSASNTFVLSLRRGETVSLRVTEGRLYEPSSTNRGYTTFSGYKIN